MIKQGDFRDFQIGDVLRYEGPIHTIVEDRYYPQLYVVTGLGFTAWGKALLLYWLHRTFDLAEYDEAVQGVLIDTYIPISAAGKRFCRALLPSKEELETARRTYGNDYGYKNQ